MLDGASVGGVAIAKILGAQIHHQSGVRKFVEPPSHEAISSKIWIIRTIENGPVMAQSNFVKPAILRPDWHITPVFRDK